MGDELNERVRQATRAKGAWKKERIQSLWSGYGEILRFSLEGSATSSVIVKVVDARAAAVHPRAFGGDISHARKLRSYGVERCFYEDYSEICGEGCRVPKAIHLSGGDGRWLFVLEDLDLAGYPERRHSVSEGELRACLNWLANFHARFMNHPGEGLWETGTYWHLATRPDELRKMKDASLFAAAQSLDETLKGARFQTLVHGDAKLANFCFPKSLDAGPGEVAAVDFQYLGRGVGVKDVAYFLSSCLDEAECEASAEFWLDVYFEQLQKALRTRGDGDAAGMFDTEALEKEWRALYPLAWADFMRFLNGWAPEHYKIHGYSLKMTRQALASIKND